MPSYNAITEEKWNVCKILIKGGASAKEVCDYMKISEGAFYKIKKSETYEEYNNERIARRMAEQKARLRPDQVAAIKAKEAEKPDIAPNEQKQVIEYRQNVTIQATHYMMQEMQKTNELLKLISNKLAFIVDELCGVKINKEA